MDQILKSMAEKRQNEIHEYFKDEKEIGSNVTPVLEMPKSLVTPSPISNQSELELHRRILESILTSQLKIIELLQRK